MEKLSKKDRDFMIDYVVEPFRRGLEPSTDLSSAASRFIFDTVARLSYGPPQILALLEEVMAVVVAQAQERGKTLGADEERRTNPAMRSVGAAVAECLRADRAAGRAILVATFDAESVRGNAFAAFNQALIALDQSQGGTR